MTDNVDLSRLTAEQKRALLARKLRRKAGPKRVPASFAQKRLWFMEQLAPGSAAYNIPGALRVHGALDIEAWRRSCVALVQRHEALRTVFEEVDGEPVQVIAESGEPEFTVVACEHLHGPDGEEGIKELARAEFARPFDLRHGPLLRITLLRLAAEEHVLLLTMHHIAGDLWSTSVAFRELVAFYREFSTGEDAGLPPLKIQYPDYALWQRDRLAGDALGPQLEYWRTTLHGAPPMLELPTDRPRPAVLGSRGGSRPFRLSAETADAMREFSRGEGATPFMTMLAAYLVLLHRYSREDDIVVGVPVANRGRREVEPLIGLFVNMLALRTDLSGAPTFRELVARVRETALGAFAHQELPFERLVEELQPERDLSRSPVFQVSFIYQNIELPRFDGVGLRMETMEVESATSRFDLVLEVFERPDGLGGSLEYNRDLFEPQTVDGFARHLERLVGTLLAEPDRPVGRLPMLSDDESRQLRERWNDTARDWPLPLAAHRRFEDLAARTPDREALRLESDGAPLSYRELNERANRLAHRLIGLGVGRDVLVGICLERSPELLVAMLAVLKAGGAYVPLDPGFPADRIAYTLEDSGLRVLLTQRSVHDELFGDRGPETGAEVLCLDELTAELTTGAAHDPGVGTDPDDLAYVIYTSGSTGRPKGVQIPHRALGNFLHSMGERPGLAADDVLLAVTTAAFDIAMLELLLPLVTGARVVLARRESAADGGRLAAELADCGATVMQATPATWRMLLDAGWTAGPGLTALVGGEALPAELAARLLATGATVWNMYGPTETTIWSSVSHVDGGPISIGEPIANTTLQVLDAAGGPVPVGVPGELCIGGDGLARGYLGRPELTAEKFADSAEGERLYRTGDLVRRRPDGRIDFLGRLDHQVKLRGYRIELGEIESVLAEQPVVAQAVALVREDTPGDQRLVAYLVLEDADPAPDGPTLARELRAALAGTLPDYMLPSAFLVLDALPLTPNGKIDRRALPAPEGGRGELRAPYAAPRDPDEELLCRLFARVLDRDEEAAEVGIDDSFFELGGHSLLATRLMSQIRSAFEVELPVRALFQAPTPAKLAEQLRAAAGPVRPALLPADRPEVLPLSFAQQRLWFLHRLEGPSPTYNIPVVLRLRGELHPQALHAALGDLVARHEALRTVFPDTDGVPRQLVLPAAEAAPELHITELTEEALPAAMSRAARHAFELTTERPLRAELLVLGERDRVLVLTIHHIAADGWSLALLGRDLANAYTARCDGAAPQWSPLPVQYADFALWQRRLLGDAEDPESLLAQQCAYWSRALDGLPERIALPTDRPHPTRTSRRGSTLEFSWDADLHAEVARVARENGSSAFMVVHAALATLLHRMGAGTDIPLGIAVAGRLDEAAAELIGFFVNTLVLRTDLGGRPSFRELLAQVRERSLDALAHQDIPFEYLVDLLKPSRSLAHHPLYQTALAWQNTPDADATMPGVAVQRLTVDTDSTRVDLHFALTERRPAADGSPAGVDGVVEFNTDIFDRGTVEALAERLGLVLRAVLADPDAPVDDVEVLTDAERRALPGWNDTARPVPQGTLAELFEAQAARTPDAVAVVSADPEQPGELTYRELDAEANRLARLLLARGAGPGRIVAVSLRRSTRLVTALLAVAKTGAAYLPVDPGYPVERIDYMLRDAAPALLVTLGADADDLPDGPVPCLLLDAPATVAQLAAADPGAPGAERPTAQHPAYVIYTSGSTGRPKGVLVPHTGIGSLVAGQRERFAVAPDSRMLQFASPSFDAAVAEMLVTLLSGAALVVAPADRMLPGDPLVRTCADHRVSHVTLPPSVLAVLDPASLPTVTTLVTAGEACPPETVAAWSAGRRMINAYGPTETTVCATMSDPLTGGAARPPIGRPIVNARAHVLDERRRPVPVGVPGELLVGGSGVALGYLGRPELTAERFVDGPDGERLYRTGDLVRRLPDGQLDFLGRIDDQVKLRGFRIEPGEIASALLAHPEIAQAVVVVREDRPGVQQLVGYVVPVAGTAPDPAALRGHLAGQLPGHLVPAACVLLTALPLTPNGKVDRAALPAPEAGAAAWAERIAPRTALERTVAAAWSAVLGVPEVGVHDDFFDLGGHSLLATQLAARLGAEHGVPVPIRTLFDRPTVAGQAGWLDEHRDDAERERIPLADRTAGIPLSFSQEDLVSYHPVPVEHHFHNVLTALVLRGTLDPAALRDSLDAIAQRHEALRTRIGSVDGVPCQLVDEVGSWPLDVVDLTDLDDETREKELRRLLTEQELGSFRVADEPLVRGALIALRPDEHVLALVMHHLVTDNWSYGVLFQELRAQYAARLDGAEPPALPELPVQYPDFADWQQRRRAAGALRERSGHWERRLAALPPSPVFRAPEHQRLEPATGATRGFAVPAAEGTALAELAREEGATLFMVVMAAFQLLLSGYAGREDITVSFPVAGREQPETENMIGFFVSHLLVRTDLAKSLTFRQLVGRVREETLDAYANQGVPLWHQEGIRERGRDPFAISFNLLNATVPALELTGLTAAPLDLRIGDDYVFPEVIIDMEASAVDLALILRRFDDGSLRGMWLYGLDVVDPRTMAAMMRQWHVLLSELTVDPDRRLAELVEVIRQD
ncbi:amino acid adenylation domain-containing protein [Kitasatospora griseola]|uniref:amino acid adenylation domain-containing protein n=1 Tax=Kitasatospora griseola TaxID=2064 RepID=UPI0036610564